MVDGYDVAVVGAGNAAFSAALAARERVERVLLDEVSEEELARTEAPPNTKEYFMADMKRLTQGRCDEKLTSVEEAQANTPVNDELTLRQHSKIEPTCHVGQGVLSYRAGAASHREMANANRPRPGL